MIIKFNPMQFWNEDAGGDFGGEGGAPEVPQHQQEPPAAPPTTAAVDLKELARTFAGELDARDEKRAASAPKTYTPEQIAEARKALKFWEPDDAFLQEFGNMETQKGALGKLRDGIFNQTIEVVKAMLAQQHEQWDSRFKPVNEMLTKREESEREARFHEAYPALKGEKAKPLVMAVGQQLATAGKFNGLTESDAFAVLASGVEAAIKELTPGFSLGAKASANNNGHVSNEIPVTSSGSGGGGGNSGGATAHSVAESILGPVRLRK